MNQQKTERNASKLDYNSTIILAITSFLCISILLIASSVQTSNELFGQGVREEDGIKAARQVIDAFNTGNVSNVSDFISERYFNVESQIDPVRGQLRGPTEFIDTVENNRIAFPDLRHNEDGIIVEHKAIRDDLTFLAQLGVIEPSSPEYVPFFQVLTGTGNRTG